MAWRLKSVMTDAEKTLLVDLNKRHQEEHSALSNPFYQKKHSIGVTIQEQVDFETAHDALHKKYDQEAVDAGLCKEYDELTEMETGLAEFLAEVNSKRVANKLAPYELKKKV